MSVDSDDPIALPKAPPPRPAARTAAIEAALRKFDEAEDAPQQPARKPPLWAGWPGMDRRVAGALATAALIAVVSIPLVLTTVRDQVPPTVTPPGETSPTEPSVQYGNAMSGEAEREVPAEAAEAPVARPLAEGQGTPQTGPALTAKRTEPSPISDDFKATHIASPPMAASAPPPPPPPAPPQQLAEEEAAADSVVVTGSRVARSNLESPSPMVVIDGYGAFLSRLQAAIRANDRNLVIGMVALPLTVNLDGQTVIYRSAREVESDFDRIFTTRVKQSALNQRSETLRGRGSGMRGTSRLGFGQTSPNGPVQIKEVTP